MLLVPTYSRNNILEEEKVKLFDCALETSLERRIAVQIYEEVFSGNSARLLLLLLFYVLLAFFLSLLFVVVFSKSRRKNLIDDVSAVSYRN